MTSEEKPQDAAASERGLPMSYLIDDISSRKLERSYSLRDFRKNRFRVFRFLMILISCVYAAVAGFMVFVSHKVVEATDRCTDYEWCADSLGYLSSYFMLAYIFVGGSLSVVTASVVSLALSARGFWYARGEETPPETLLAIAKGAQESGGGAQHIGEVIIRGIPEGSGK